MLTAGVLQIAERLQKAPDRGGAARNTAKVAFSPLFADVVAAVVKVSFSR